MYSAGWEACAAAEAVELARPGAHANAQSVQRRGLSWLWPLSAAGLVLVSLTLVIALETRTPAVRVVYVERPGQSSVKVEQVEPAIRIEASGPTIPPLDRAPIHPRHEYFALRGRVLASGVDALGSGSTAATSGEQAEVKDSRYGALLHELRGG
jgi:hypothetical protein